MKKKGKSINVSIIFIFLALILIAVSGYFFLSSNNDIESYYTTQKDNVLIFETNTKELVTEARIYVSGVSGQDCFIEIAHASKSEKLKSTVKDTMEFKFDDTHENCWSVVFSGESIYDKYFRIRTTGSYDICEFALIDTKGKVVDLQLVDYKEGEGGAKGFYSENGFMYKIKHVEGVKTIDEQSKVRFTNLLKTSYSPFETDVIKSTYDFSEKSQGIEKYGIMPLGVCVYYLSTTLFGQNMLAFRLVPIVCFAFIIIGIYLLFQEVFDNSLYGVLSAVLFVFLNITLTTSLLARVNNLAVTCLIFSYYHAVKYMHGGKASNVILSGIFGGLSINFHIITGIGFLGSIALILIGLIKNKRKNILSLIIGCLLLPIIITFGVFGGWQLYFGGNVKGIFTVISKFIKSQFLSVKTGYSLSSLLCLNKDVIINIGDTDTVGKFYAFVNVIGGYLSAICTVLSIALVIYSLNAKKSESFHANAVALSREYLIITIGFIISLITSVIFHKSLYAIDLNYLFVFYVAYDVFILKSLLGLFEKGYIIKSLFIILLVSWAVVFAFTAIGSLGVITNVKTAKALYLWLIG